MNGSNAARMISRNVLIHLVKGNHENDPKKDDKDKWVRFRGYGMKTRKGITLCGTHRTYFDRFWVRKYSTIFCAV